MIRKNEGKIAVYIQIQNYLFYLLSRLLFNADSVSEISFSRSPVVFEL